ncbi:RING-finger-containing E3 ubiquitin ligase [Encephalitozoon intestinalis ATCC 50506]|uniref:RING-type E3 ubiquitin transferase n=1 Tax=Encephalitozoon intestinalis (strain ATCC 50506) TaxID=876142 RepID=E0S9X9_ENCIT|nr:RING-finger-containing E3 ubiquitin ligase [Encephalitozoon intestinalis ATCC 50506]ADM12601.2 RING-finger-containing E3 ubiquitin ligase [Encephalitozoon intestinalis ATCC 50506]
MKTREKSEEWGDKAPRSTYIEDNCREKERRRVGREYACNICYSRPEGPVLTPCGHLFCWGCLYIWSQSIRGCKFCPSCRSRMGIEEVISVLAVDSKKESRGPPPRPANNRKLVKVITPGVKINGTRFGNCLLQEEETNVFSYRTAIGLFTLMCLLISITLRSYGPDC